VRCRAGTASNSSARHGPGSAERHYVPHRVWDTWGTCAEIYRRRVERSAGLLRPTDVGAVIPPQRGISGASAHPPSARYRSTRPAVPPDGSFVNPLLTISTPFSIPRLDLPNARRGVVSRRFVANLSNFGHISLDLRNFSTDNSSTGARFVCSTLRAFPSRGLFACFILQLSVVAR